MRCTLTLILLLFAGQCFAQEKKEAKPTIADKTEGCAAYDGFFKYYWDEDEGKIWLEIDRWDEEFLYVNSLPAGLGSNDIGLDRNQLGDSRIVKFTRSGNKVLLQQPNYRYRATSDKPEERRTVAEAFASSVLWGFKAAAVSGQRVLIDLTPFLLRDAHGVADRLKSRKQGKYKLEADRSAVYLPRTKNFPLNTEFEATVTFTGEPEGQWVRSVTPTPEAVTLRMHHSFVQLPDDNYQPRPFDPRSGYSPISYQDYATPIDQPLTKRFIRRHRLQKKEPGAKKSEPVAPIVYYVDRGVPEPIRSALIEGAGWWNEAFEAAGYENAFQVKVLPVDADPMDVRYNVINWVHRSTRGWSYGSSVVDPRTGEIIKGHVLLGSLRVRQDFLIAQGLAPAYKNGAEPDPRLLEMALARLRQLSAHEVGHTLGLAHNFAASYNDRASVMDYPHPYIKLDKLDRIDFSEAYDTGIGEWDKRTILYGYQDFPEGVDETAVLNQILSENNTLGLAYLTDQDARPAYGAHPYAHLWDNGRQPAEELRRLMQVRKIALEDFGPHNIPTGAPLATLENVLVPLYLAHRYQVEATAKLIGGLQYSYAVRGDGQVPVEIIPDERQRDALAALLETLDPAFLALPERLLEQIPPLPPGYSRNRELFKVHTGLSFDPLGAAESSARHTIRFLLNPERLARLVEQSARQEGRLSVAEVLDALDQAVRVKTQETNTFEAEIARVAEKLTVLRLLALAARQDINQQVVAEVYLKLVQLKERYARQAGFSGKPQQNAHYHYLLHQIELFQNNPKDYQLPETPEMPDGSPIGCGGF